MGQQGRLGVPEKSTWIGGRDHACLWVVAVRSASAVRIHSWAPWILGILNINKHLSFTRTASCRKNSLPNDDILSRHVLCLAYTNLTSNASRVQWCWYPQYNVIGIQFRIESGPEVDGILDTRFRGFHDMSLKAEGEIDVCCWAVTTESSAQSQVFSRVYIPHELELAVWGDKADWSITIKLAQSHALVELTIVKLHCWVRFGCLFTAPSMTISDYICDGKLRCMYRFWSTNLSLRPNLHSGVPLRYARMRIRPSTSALKMVPVAK